MYYSLLMIYSSYKHTDYAYSSLRRDLSHLSVLSPRTPRSLTPPLTPLTPQYLLKMGQEMEVDVSETLRSLRAKAPAALHEALAAFGDLYEKK